MSYFESREDRLEAMGHRVTTEAERADIRRNMCRPARTVAFTVTCGPTVRYAYTEAEAQQIAASMGRRGRKAVILPFRKGGE